MDKAAFNPSAVTPSQFLALGIVGVSIAGLTVSAFSGMPSSVPSFAGGMPTKYVIGFGCAIMAITVIGILIAMVIKDQADTCDRITAQVRGSQWKTLAGAVGTAIAGGRGWIELTFPSGLKEIYRTIDLERVQTA